MLQRRLRLNSRLRNVGHCKRQTSWIFHEHYSMQRCSCTRHKRLDFTSCIVSCYYCTQNLMIRPSKNAVHVPDHLLCSASWTCGASCCRRWGAGTWRRMTCAATRGYSWSTGRKRHVHFTQNPRSTSWDLQLKRMGRFLMWIKCLTWSPSWRLLYVQSCMRCCLRKNNNNDVICAFES